MFYSLTHYNVSLTNNIINFRDNFDNSKYSVIIPPGNYTFFDIASVIQNELNNAGSSITFSVIYNETTFKINFSGTSNFQLLWSDTINSMGYLLGFFNIDTPITNDINSTNAINLSVPPYLAIYISEFLSSSRFGSRYYTFILNSLGNGGDINLHFNENNFHLHTENYLFNISLLHVQIYDLRTGQIYDNNNVDISLLFEFN